MSQYDPLEPQASAPEALPPAPADDDPPEPDDLPERGGRGEQPPDTLAWGVGFGLLIGVPLMLFGGGTLNGAVQRAFAGMSGGEMLAYVVFVMPIAETLFFRGILHGSRPFWMVGLMASAWSIVLYLPMLDVVNFPLVAVVICLVLVMLNVMYGYVRNRNGLAAAWVCQVVANVLVLFLPFVAA
ncbi:MAG: hypothetical protein MUC99_08255 [Anaerolineae bacterium]|nr:hypothetical protein [Anaerolineae bacterium]